MYSNPKITFTCVTYNRWKMLRNLLLSFVKTNQYDNFEWVILHHDCTDNTENFLNNIFEDPQFKSLKNKINVVTGYEKEYLDFLKEKNINLDNTPKRVMSHFSKWRNDIIRDHASGEILIDIPDDHQFIWNGNYCQEIIDVFNDRVEKIGYNDISTLTFRTKYHYRLLKSNNKKSKVNTTNSGVDYYIVETPKSHEEWHAITYDNFKKVGFYTQLEDTSDEVIAKWNNSDHYYYFHTAVLCEKFNEAGLKRAVLKVPMMHDCLDGKYEDKTKDDKCIFHIFDNKLELAQFCENLNRPLSIEEYERLSNNHKKNTN